MVDSLDYYLGQKQNIAHSARATILPVNPARDIDLRAHAEVRDVAPNTPSECNEMHRDTIILRFWRRFLAGVPNIPKPVAELFFYEAVAPRSSRPLGKCRHSSTKAFKLKRDAARDIPGALRVTVSEPRATPRKSSQPQPSTVRRVNHHFNRKKKKNGFVRSRFVAMLGAPGAVGLTVRRVQPSQS